jgi:phosphoribosyl-ATP pyrophosphohydrolase
MAAEESTELMDFCNAEDDENVIVETKSSIFFVFI